MKSSITLGSSEHCSLYETKNNDKDSLSFKENVLFSPDALALMFATSLLGGGNGDEGGGLEASNFETEASFLNFLRMPPFCEETGV